MGSTSESSHVGNIANFKLLIILCEELGSVYNPGNIDLSVASMTARCAALETMHNDYVVAKMATNLPINNKQELIRKLKNIASRSKEFFVATNTSASNKNDVKGLVRMITGSNVRRKKSKDGTPIGKWVSNSRLGVDNILDNFKDLLNYYESDTNYAPNETELKVASLKTLINDLEAASLLASSVTMDEKNLRRARNEGLYMEGTGLVDVSLKCKRYIRSVFGARSKEAKLASEIKLKRFLKIRK
jgi:hypothetical protein